MNTSEDVNEPSTSVVNTRRQTRSRTKLLSTPEKEKKLKEERTKSPSPQKDKSPKGNPKAKGDEISTEIQYSPGNLQGETLKENQDEKEKLDDRLHQPLERITVQDREGERLQLLRTLLSRKIPNEDSECKEDKTQNSAKVKEVDKIEQLSPGTRKRLRNKGENNELNPTHVDKGKGKRRKKDTKSKHTPTEEEQKMGNWLSKWLFGSKQEDAEPDWRERVNQRAEEEARWERKEKERILRAKALLPDPPSDTDEETVDITTMTLMEQREHDERRASRQKEHYDIRKQRLQFVEEDRLELTAAEIAKLRFKVQSRSNEETGEWDYSLLPEFRDPYERLVLKNHEDATRIIARRKERWEEEQRMKEEWKRQATLIDVSLNRTEENAASDTLQQSVQSNDSQQTVIANPDDVNVSIQNEASNHSNASVTTSPNSSDSDYNSQGSNLDILHTINGADFAAVVADSSPSAMEVDDVVPNVNDVIDRTIMDDWAHQMSSSSAATDDTVDIDDETNLMQEERRSFFFNSTKKQQKKQAQKEAKEREEKKVKIGRKRKLKLVSNWSMEDTREYREGYPGKLVIPDIVENKEFYFNERPSEPDGGYIEDILTDWKGDFARLERHHGYIQWLFPIREKGMNYQSYELQPHEAKAIMEDEVAHKRVVRSYQLMLDFYGLELTDPEKGTIARAEHWKPRFQHLNRSFHNYLRITRILKCLGELGYEHYKVPFVKFMLYEAIVNETLPSCGRSCMEYWMYTIKDKTTREKLVRQANQLIDETCENATANL